MTIPPRDRLTICFAHPAYQMAERFAARSTGIAHSQARTPEAFREQVPSADVVVVSMMWKNPLVEIAGRVRFIQSISAGIDQYDKDLLRDRGIRLASAAGVNAEAVAQHAMALILALHRHIHTGRDNQSAKHWRGMISNIAAREDQLDGAQFPVYVESRVINGYFPALELKRLIVEREDLSYIGKVTRNADRGAIPGFTFVREGAESLNDYIKQCDARMKESVER